MFVDRKEETTLPVLPDDELEFLPTLTRQALRATGMYELRQRIKKQNPELDRRMIRDLARILHKESWDKRDIDMIRNSKARLPYIRKKGSNTLAKECGIFGIERKEQEQPAPAPEHSQQPFPPEPGYDIVKSLDTLDEIIREGENDECPTGEDRGGIHDDRARRVRDSGLAGTDR